MYRKVPVDLMEGTKRGSALSYLALLTMIFLFAMETKSFISSKIATDLQLDRSEDPRIRLNFNITMMDLQCDFAVVDVVSVLGTDQNVTAHVTKWQMDAGGVRRRYQGRNRNQKDILLFDEAITETLEEMHEDGEDAISLDEKTLEFAKHNHDYVFVDFYASWCSHCRELAPTWEAMAEVMDDVAGHNEDHLGQDYSQEDYDAAGGVKFPVLVGKVDCVNHQDLCNRVERIQAYPTLRLFVDGERWRGGDYRGHRTVLEMVEWLQHVETQHHELLERSESFKHLHHAHEAAKERILDGVAPEEEKQWSEKIMRQKKKLRHEWVDEEHPGCQISGHLLLDRAPGNFHIQARSKNHDLAAHMTNVSHVIHSLYIGDPIGQKRILEGQANVPPEVRGKLAPMDGLVYPTYQLHEAYHHYLKVVATNVDDLKIGKRKLKVYQIMENSQLAYYRNDVIPEAKFIFDLSPIAVSYRKEGRHWYDYMTSIMAIIGGIFTVVGMLESSIHTVVASTRSRRAARPTPNNRYR